MERKTKNGVSTMRLVVGNVTAPKGKADSRRANRGNTTAINPGRARKSKTDWQDLVDDAVTEAFEVISVSVDAIRRVEETLAQIEGGDTTGIASLKQTLKSMYLLLADNANTLDAVRSEAGIDSREYREGRARRDRQASAS